MPTIVPESLCMSARHVDRDEPDFKMVTDEPSRGSDHPAPLPGRASGVGWPASHLLAGRNRGAAVRGDCGELLLLVLALDRLGLDEPNAGRIRLMLDHVRLQRA